MKESGTNLSVPMSRQPILPDMMAMPYTPPMPNMMPPMNPMSIPGMAASQLQLDTPGLEPVSGNQKQPIVKQFNPDARLGSGAEGNVKRPIQSSKSQK